MEADKDVGVIWLNARELGLKSIGLQVFAHNAVAKGLYESIGYEIKSLNMTKQI